MSKVLNILQSQQAKLDSVEESLVKIAFAADKNTETLISIDRHLEKLCGALTSAATKDRIPTKVFVYTIFMFGFVFAIERLTNSGTNLDVSHKGLHIEQQPQAK
jgi:hypothetical protein